MTHLEKLPWEKGLKEVEYIYSVISLRKLYYKWNVEVKKEGKNIQGNERAMVELQRTEISIVIGSLTSVTEKDTAGGRDGKDEVMQKQTIIRELSLP